MFWLNKYPWKKNGQAFLHMAGVAGLTSDPENYGCQSQQSPSPSNADQEATSNSHVVNTPTWNVIFWYYFQ